VNKKRSPRLTLKNRPQKSTHLHRIIDKQSVQPTPKDQSIQVGLRTFT